ncbi:tripartite tricarboxylate transporter TctB family protein [Pseudoroseicyclus sp. H15]
MAADVETKGSPRLDRVLGGLIALFGLYLLIWGIPANVAVHGDKHPSPRLFPQIGAWIMLLGGVAQAIFASGTSSLPPAREVGRFALVSVLTLGMVVLMEMFGYLVGAIALIAILMFVVNERRPLWIFVAVVAVPVGVWLFFEKLLDRPLP